MHQSGKTIALIENSGQMFGGGQVSFHGLLSILAKQRNCLVIVPGEGSFEKAARAHAPVHVVAMPSLRSPTALMHFQRNVAALVRLFRKHRVGLVHANGSRCAIYAGLAARIAGIPMIWHVRMADRDIPLDAFLYSLAAKVIVNSQWTSGRFSGYPASAEKVVVIYNGVDQEFGRSADKGSPESPKSEGPRAALVVGNAARFVDFKGLPMFIDVCRTIAVRHLNASFALIGSGPLAEALATRALDLRERLTFLGHREDMSSALSTLDILLFTSLGEPFGRVLIEAMSLGIPIVAFKSGGVPEIVVHGSTGFLAEPGDLFSMTAFVSRLLDDPQLRRNMGERGRQRALSLFSQRKHVQAVERIYDQLLP